MPISEPAEIDISNEMPVRLRGHHLLCILTYRGYGYTQPFIDNMSSLVEAIAQGRRVTLVEGPDDICNGFTPECREICDHDCSKPSTAEMDVLATEAVVALIPLGAGKPFALNREHVALMRQAFAAGYIRRACQQCSWKDFCTGIAADEFSDVRLFAPQGSPP